ncbi:uncharacterized protein LOC127861818 [Dreissena polymorpha]|nr:uncharacterized protein LOC127861818 [Dreissena polymorpha]
MDQDLSLMKQLLKLNDKIEEIKTQVIYRNRNEAFSTSSMSTSEISDSEYSDTDDSRIDIYNASTGTHKLKTLKSLNHLGKAHVRHPEEVDSEAETANGSNDVSFGHEPKLIERSGSDVIVYRKKHRKKHRSKSHRNSGDETETQTEESDTEGSISDTESSCDSGSTKMAPSDGDDNLDDVIDAPDSGIQSPTPEKAVEPPKPRKGGISQNSSFLNFHKTNGTRYLNPLAGNVLTHQGHNISLEKYFIPQGLVYLKHANADNVFCQFTK